MAGTACVEVADGEGEIDPLSDADGELVFALKRFEDEPIVPVGEVLNGGDAVRECIVDGEQESLAARVGIGWRNVRRDEIEGRAFANDTGGVAIGVTVDLSAGRIARSVGDVGGAKSGGVGNGDVAVGALEESGMAAGDGVEIMCRGERFTGPLGVVPAAAEDPLTGGQRCGVAAEFCLHRGE